MGAFSRGICLFVLGGALVSIFPRAAEGRSHCREIFEQVLNDERGGYCRGYCYRNIPRLVERLRGAQIDVTGARVFVVRMAGGTDFHVVLELKGQIYDFDDELGISPASDYFQRHFPQRWQGIMVVTAVASDEYYEAHLSTYLKDHSFTVEQYLDHLRRPAGEVPTTSP